MIEEIVLKEFEEEFEGKNVLVTGGTGLIGRQVVDILCNILCNIHVKIVSLDNIKINNKAEHIIGDITDFKFCKDITKDVDYVFHLAGIKGSADISEKKLASHFVPILMMNTNMLEACRINEVKKVVYTSSIGAYSNTDIFRESDYCIDSMPMDFAGWSKRMAELQIYAYKVQYDLNNFSIVRPCNVYGPGDQFNSADAMVIPSIMHRILMHKNGNKKSPIQIYGDGSAIRDFAYSRDVAEGIILALYYGTSRSPTGFVNLGSGKGYTIKELVDTLHSFIDFNYEFDVTKSSGFPKRVMDISLARELICYNPTTSLLDGLKETWNWYVNNQDESNNKKNYFNEK